MGLRRVPLRGWKAASRVRPSRGRNRCMVSELSLPFQSLYSENNPYKGLDIETHFDTEIG